MNTTTINRSKSLAEFGFEIRSGAPSPDHGMIKFGVVVSLNGKTVYDGPFSLGIGHVDPNGLRIPAGMSNEEIVMLNSWKKNRYAAFKDKDAQCRLACRLATAQGVKPELADVLYCLLSDGEAFFNCQSFEDWARESGYDPDSRTAEAIYRACDSIGRKLSALVPKDILDQAREILKDY